MGLLFTFKYFNFFVASFYDLFYSSQNNNELLLINIILPVGISFYTFQTLSYTIDVYNNKIKPSTSLLDLAVYVSFFPQLVAGPIERAARFLPQVMSKRSFDYSSGVTGIKLIIIGFFKKIVIADSFASSVDIVFSNIDNLSYISLIIGCTLFSFQIYCDFSGYTDIARGLGKLLGFDLMLNFNYPYFSKSISEFWKRWHISLTSWFRDYMYIPLGGSRVSNLLTVRNIFLVFIISGLWHGANLTFLFWGLIHALLYMPTYIFKRFNINIKNIKFTNNSLSRFLNPLFLFVLITIAWVFFRSENLNDAFNFIYNMLSFSEGRNYFTIENMGLSKATNLFFSLLCLAILLIYEYFEYLGKKIKWNEITSSFALILIILFGQFADDNVFIYFQF